MKGLPPPLPPPHPPPPPPLLPSARNCHSNRHAGQCTVRRKSSRPSSPPAPAPLPLRSDSERRKNSLHPQEPPQDDKNNQPSTSDEVRSLQQMKTRTHDDILRDIHPSLLHNADYLKSDPLLRQYLYAHYLDQTELEEIDWTGMAGAAGGSGDNENTDSEENNEMNGWDEDDSDQDDWGMERLSSLVNKFEKLRLRNHLEAFSHGDAEVRECCVCLEVTNLYKRKCCSFAVCDECIEQFLTTQISEGQLKISCMSDTCDIIMDRDEILARVSVPVKEKYYRFLVDANKDPKVKTCPRCCQIYKLKDEEALAKNKYGMPVECTEENCKLIWCFECQAPYHSGVKCRDFVKGDKMVKKWAQEKHYGQNNAQRCPGCKIFIERKCGCDHMTCSKCKTSFCYKCGERYLSVKFFGNHLSRYSPLGCKYNYIPERPVVRRLVRGSVFGAKLLGGVMLAGVGVALAGVLIGTAPITLPILGAYQLKKRHKRRQRMKRHRRIVELTSRRLHEHLCKTAQAPRDSLKLYADTMHIGIQTGSSQEVDVTVHNPYQLESSSTSSDSEMIRVNFMDLTGNWTVTTAEITHNASDEDGREPGMVLHVKTSYIRDHKDESVVTLENSDPVNDHLESAHRSGDQNSDSISKFGTYKCSHSGYPKAVVHRRAHSTGSIRRPSRFGSMSTKSKRSLTPQNSHHFEPGLLPHPRLDADQSPIESSLDLEGYKASVYDDQGIESKTVNQSGCFMKLFSKKPTTSQSQSDRERPDISRDKPDISKHMQNDLDLHWGVCPDVVACTLESGARHKELAEWEGANQGVSVGEQGLVAKETLSTYL